MSRKVHFSYKNDSWDLERTVFQYGHTDPHLPRIIVIGAMHGNEPSGLRAMLELAPYLREVSAQMQGMVCGLIGNFRALEQNKRFIDFDFNRMWKDDSTPVGTAERQEKIELQDLLKTFLAGSGSRYVLDLHTTSSESRPFMSHADTSQNRAFAAQFAIPAIAGIERFIKGALLEHVSELGHVAIAFEAGQHIAPESVDHHREFVLRALHHTGIHMQSQYAGIEEGLEYDIVYRHALSPGDGFVMNPGYSNFSEVHKGQVVARDSQGDVRAPKSGLLFMPLYQAAGDDGFFIVR